MPTHVQTPADRVRLRMQEWLDTTGIGQRAFAHDLQKTQVWLQKILAGENHVRLRDLDRVATAMRTTAAELLRDDDEDRYRLELTPSEVRLIERLRHRPDVFDTVSALLRVTSKKVADTPASQATPRKKA